MRVSDYTEAPYQGVSQAPSQVRLSTQAEAVDDWIIQVPEGAQPRPPFQYVATLAGVPDRATATIEHIKKLGVGEFVFVLSQGAPFGAVLPLLFKLDGTSVPLTVNPDAAAYLRSGAEGLGNDYSMLTVQDYTFICNRNVKVANVATLTATRPHEAMVWVRSAGYARTYSVTVTPSGGSPVTVTLKTPNGKDASDGDDVDTGTIAAALNGASYPVSANGVANGATLSGSITTASLGGAFTVTRVGEILYITNPTLDFTVKVEDGQGGVAMVAIKDRAQAFSDLPKRVPADGFTVRISQQTGTEDDDFFVRFRETAGPGTGVWEETIEPGSNLGADPKTLPVGLVYDQGAGTWSLDILAWQPRTVGNPTLAPDPGYIGKVITDVTFWKERLGLLHSEGIRLSSASDPLVMYPETLTQVLASDAIEMGNPLTQQADFRYALSFKSRLILWGTKGQAQVTSGGQPLSPQTANADPYSYYEQNGVCPPQASNDRIYFVAPRGVYNSAVYEMEVQLSGNSEVQEGDDMTVSVARYLPPGINRAATCPVNYMTVYGEAGGESLYVHYYRYADRQRVQNAWSRWRLPKGALLVGTWFDNTTLYVVMARGGLVQLLSMELAAAYTDPGADYVTRLDYRHVPPTGPRVYNATFDTTEITLLVPLYDQPRVAVSYPGGQGGMLVDGVLADAPLGTEAEVFDWSPGSSTLLLKGNWLSAPLFVGEGMPLNVIRLSRIYYRDKAGRVDRSGKMVIKKLILELDNTAFLRVRVTIGGRRSFLYTFEGHKWTSPGSDYDRVDLYEGKWEVPIGGESDETTIELISDSYLPASVLGYTWEGEINPRTKRLTSQ